MSKYLDWIFHNTLLGEILATIWDSARRADLALNGRYTFKDTCKFLLINCSFCLSN